jgi:hypothetical protein
VFIVVINAQKTECVHHSHYSPEDRECLSWSLLSKRQNVHHHGHYCPEDRMFIIMVITVQNTESVHHIHYCPEDRVFLMVNTVNTDWVVCHCAFYR